MDAPEANFTVEFGKYCSTAEFIRDFIQGQGLIVFIDDGFI